MNIYPLIFSNNNNYRLTRHAIFWFIWIAYYTAFSTYAIKGDFPLQNRFLSSLIEVTLSTPMDMVFCYAIIYFLLPKFLFRGQYISMILLWLLFSVIFMVAFEIHMAKVIPLVRGWFGLPIYKRTSGYFWIFFGLFSQINMEGCMAAAIKLGKISFIKQKEIDLLRTEKEKLQTRQDSTEMQPMFLVDIINRMALIVKQKSIDVSEVMQKIRNLMISIMYENANAKVSLKRELELVKEYIELEQCTKEDVIDVSFSVSGNIEQESIGSFTLLLCIQNAFNQVSDLNLNNKKIDFKVKVANRALDVLVSWNKPLYTSTLTEGKNIILRNLDNRLKLIYPESHEIKVFIEVEKIIVSLKIDLKGAIN